MGLLLFLREVERENRAQRQDQGIKKDGIPLPQPLGPAISISSPAGKEKEIFSMAGSWSRVSVAGAEGLRFASGSSSGER